MEGWRTIVGYEAYEASSLGNIRRKGAAVNLKLRETQFGYIHVGIHSKNRFVHRMVALAWIPNPENKRCVNHKNSKRADNRPCNLEWVTHSENQKHAYSKGRRKHVIPGFLGKRHTPETKLIFSNAAKLRNRERNEKGQWV